MSRKDLIKKKFSAVMAAVKKELYNVPDNVCYANDYRKFFRRTLQKFKTNGRILNYRIKVDSDTNEFNITYQPYCGDRMVVVTGEFNSYGMYCE